MSRCGGRGWWWVVYAAAASRRLLGDGVLALHPCTPSSTQPRPHLPAATKGRRRPVSRPGLTPAPWRTPFPRAPAGASVGVRMPPVGDAQERLARERSAGTCCCELSGHPSLADASVLLWRTSSRSARVSKDP